MQDAGLKAAGGVLGAAEAASPVEAVEAVTRKLGLALGATAVSFLIADMSGRALVRLAHVPLDASMAWDDVDLVWGERRAAGESAVVIPFEEGRRRRQCGPESCRFSSRDDRGRASSMPTDGGCSRR
jgi:hypothetical protein